MAKSLLLSDVCFQVLFGQQCQSAFDSTFSFVTYPAVMPLYGFYTFPSPVFYHVDYIEYFLLFLVHARLSFCN